MAEESAKMENELKTLSSKRRGKLCACTRKMNEIRALIAAGGNTERVLSDVEQFKMTLNEFKDAHIEVQMLLPAEVKENETMDWYEPKMETFRRFLWDEVSMRTLGPSDPQESVLPHDSISNVSKQTKRSGTGSSVHSERLKIATERAILEVRKSALKQKHAVEMEKKRLQDELERIELETDIAAAEATLKVLDNFDEAPKTEQGKDGMNEYLLLNHQGPEVTTAGRQLQQDHTGPRHPRSDVSEETDSGNHNSALLTMIQKQNEIADLLVRQQKRSSLPSRQIPVFDGDPLSFQTFMRAFKHGIEDKTSNVEDRLYYLEQYTSGQPRELVRSCFHMKPDRGYGEALRLLKIHFGDGMKIANAYMEKALNWSDIKANDGKALHAYALYLRGCCNAMRELQDMGEMDLVSTLKLILSKLPYGLKEKWRTTAYELLERNQERARFPDLVAFIEKQANILQDPLFGDIQDSMPKRGIPKGNMATDSKQQTKQRWKSSFAMATEMSDHGAANQARNREPQNRFVSVRDDNCCICNTGKHSLNECEMLKLQPRDVKVQLLKEKGICFGCLNKGHMSKTCKRRLTCQHCQGMHPSILHIANKELEEKTDQTTLVSLGREDDIGAGKDCKLAIVPVLVKASKGSKTILTYAFLDPGSTATFCTEALMRQLNATGRKTKVLLQTMGQRKPVSSYEITGLQVSDLDGNNFIELQKTYTQTKIPVTKENICSQKDLDRWPYLKEIKVQEVDAEVELLIGVDVPKAMEPWQIINSQGNGPYAVRTLLGWVVNGPLNSSSAVDKFGRPMASVNHISIEQGPEFLQKAESQWPKNTDKMSQSSLSSDDPEVKRNVIVNTTSIEGKSPTSKLIEYYSDWNSLKKAVAWILKLKGLLLEITQRRKITDTGLLLSNERSLKERAINLKVPFGADLTVKDMDNAEMAICAFEQRQHFVPEFALLEKGKYCRKDSPILKMDPILDQGVLRVGGRINKSAMPVSAKNPIILPKKAHVSEMILRNLHKQVGHSGRNHLLLLKTNPVMPSGLFKKEDLYSRRRWRRVQYLADLFWRRCVREYLPIMQQRNKWNEVKRNFLPGDLVVIVDDSAPRNSWVPGRIVKTMPGSKGLVRSVLVKTRTSVLWRPITKLCLLLEAGK